MEQPSEYQDKAWRQWGPSTDWPALLDVLASVPEPFDVENIESVLRRYVDDLGVKPKEVYQPIRVALTGTTVSPGIFESLWALGREESLSRLAKAHEKAGSEAA